MKTLYVTLILFFSSFTGIPNKPVDSVDLHRFAGKWYSLYSIPTYFDKGTRETTTTYNWNAKKEYYNVVTTYKKGNDPGVHSVNSKLFQVEGTHNAEMKAQFLWPYKVDYWVIELADDYSYVVVGHPDHKYLFIMSRTPSIDKNLLQHIISRCKAMGYPVEKLVSQKHSTDQ
ncbi:lipocalin family protein [Mucilaginibacter segetis]|uniref:Lipocalin family protein n=1 Tax=Mucilaginibacter segetis TaxID=2793071 RepID=A0A934UNV1_9SPHI|nr:lipocalin family protein [Mucilaginibacter segetis]MBK0381173.1 lipocalin family protein [Mucilaginibacter segetis]